MLYFLLLLVTGSLACSSFNGRSLGELSITVSNIEFIPLAWASSPGNLVFGYSDYSVGAGQASAKINSMISDMLKYAVTTAAPRGLASTSRQILRRITFQVTNNYPIVRCDDLRPSIEVAATVRPAANPGQQIPNRTCIVSGDNLIVGICKNTDLNCTLVRGNFPSQSNQLNAFAQVSPATIGNIGALDLMELGNVVTNPQFITQLSDSAAVFLRNSPYKAAFENSQVTIQRGSGRNAQSLSQINLNTNNIDDDDGFNNDYGKKRK